MKATIHFIDGSTMSILDTSFPDETKFGLDFYNGKTKNHTFIPVNNVKFIEYLKDRSD